MHSIVVRYFDEVARQGSIRKAAKVLNVASTAVNRQILGLEKELRVKLFERVHSGVVLTPAGQLALEHVRDVLHDFESLRIALNELRGKRTQRVRLVCLDSLIYTVLPNVFDWSVKEFSNVSLALDVAGPAGVIERITSKQAELGVTFDDSESPDVQCLYKVSSPIGVIVSSSHPLAARQSVTMLECAEYPRISTNNATAEYRLHAMEAAIEKSGISFTKGYSSNSFHMVKYYIKRGQGFGLFTRIGISKEIQDGELCFLPLMDSALADAKIGIYVAANRGVPPFLSTLANKVSEELAHHV